MDNPSLKKKKKSNASDIGWVEVKKEGRREERRDLHGEAAAALSTVWDRTVEFWMCAGVTRASCAGSEDGRSAWSAWHRMQV